MLVVLSAALRFHSKPATEVAKRTAPRLLSKAKVLVQELRKLEAKDIKKQLHVNDALAKQYHEHLGKFEARDTIPACSLYDSSLFNMSGMSEFDEDDADWANSHVRVFSGLYGLLRPFDEIQPLSLPVGLNTKLTTTKGKFLRDYWKDLITQEIRDALERMPMPVVINMAAEEDNVLLERDVLPGGTRVVTVDFKTIDKDARLEAQGEFLRWMLETRCMTVEELLEFKGLVEEGQAASFRLHPKQTGPDTLVFEENIGDGGTGGWSKKLAQFGGSKSKFIKEMASGKERYQRTEINKALRQDIDKKRKGSKAEYG